MVIEKPFVFDLVHCGQSKVVVRMSEGGFNTPYYTSIGSRRKRNISIRMASIDTTDTNMNVFYSDRVALAVSDKRTSCEGALLLKWWLPETPIFNAGISKPKPKGETSWMRSNGYMMVDGTQVEKVTSVSQSKSGDVLYGSKALFALATLASYSPAALVAKSTPPPMSFPPPDPPPVASYSSRLRLKPISVPSAQVAVESPPGGSWSTLNTRFFFVGAVNVFGTPPLTSICPSTGTQRSIVTMSK
jgi:hypothetical protein